MTELMSHLGRTLCGQRPPGDWLSTRDKLEIFVAYAGSGRAAGRALGVPESTLRGWRKGVTPKRNLDFVVPLARRLLSDRRGIIQPARAGTTELAIRGIFTVSQDTRDRTIYPGRYIPRAIINDVLDLWLANRDDDAEALLVSAIDAYYTPLQFDHIERVWFQ